MSLSLATAAVGNTSESSRVAGTVRLTADGGWTVFLIGDGYARCLDQTCLTGEVELVMRSARGTEERRHVLSGDSPGVTELELSPSGKWITTLIAEKSSNSAVTEGKLAVFEIESGKRLDVDRSAVRNFRFSGQTQEDWLILERAPEKTAGQSFALELLNPQTTKVVLLGTAERLAVDPTGQRLVWVSSDRLKMYDLSAQRLRELDHSPDARYSELTWSAQGGALAAFRASDSEASLLTFTGLKAGAPKRRLFAPKDWPGFPAGHRLGARALPTQNYPSESVLVWRADERGLFFGTRPAESPAASPAVVSNLALWHWRDPYAPTEHARLEKITKDHGYLAFVDIASGRCVPLANEALRVVEPHGRAMEVLAFDDRPYRHLNHLGPAGGFVQRDYYLMDLRSGRARPLARALWVTTRNGKSNIPRVSPNGAFAVYQRNGDYFAYDVAKGRHRNLTADLPTRFYFPEDLRNSRHARDDDTWLESKVFQGWTKDDRALISDYRDVWALPLKDGVAVNLTGNGRSDDIVYRATTLADIERAGIYEVPGEPFDLSRPLHFTMKDRKTGNTGLARHDPGQKGVTVLRSEYALLDAVKAERASIHLLTRHSSAAPSSHWVVDERWQPLRNILDEAELGPQPVSPPTLYLAGTLSDGRKSYSVLAPPRGYRPGQKYPTLVVIYEELDAAPHTRRAFPAPVYDRYHDDGYALLYPGIQARYNEAGKAALEGVMAAVDAAVASGVVDRERLGLTGYSMGAYNTLMVVSQTDAFKAAVPRSTTANLWSDYGSLYGRSMYSFRGMESTQPYMAGPWWENWQAFLDNSPLYRFRSINTPLLLVHGDQDDATTFENILELFASMRRLGTKPVVMLQYVGEGHVSYNDDSEVRMKQFFDHFLKGAPAPRWWSEGQSIPAGQVPKAGLPQARPSS